MYTNNLNPKTSKLESVTLSCNEKGCKSHTTGKTRAEAWLAAREAKWLMGHAGQEVCNVHRAGYKIVDGKLAIREAKAEKADGKVTKTKVAQTKVAKKADKADKVTTTKSGAKLTVGNRVPAKAETSVTGLGQSTGKLAKSAKKSAK